MRTLLVFHLGGVGGPSRSLENLAAWLAEEGEVSAVFPEEGDAADRYRRLADVAIAPYTALTYARRPADLARTAAAMARDARTFRRELDRRRPDLVVVVTTVLPAALLAARSARVPVVVYAAELYAQPWKASRLLPLWGAALMRATAAAAEVVVCCSHAVAAQFPRSHRVVVAYPPVGPRYAAGDRERGRRRHGVEDGEPVVAVVGNLSRGRGQDVALRALAVVRRDAPRARMVLAGRPHPRPVDLEYAAELRRLVVELDLRDAVVFSQDADAADLYAAADVVVNPARLAEAFGRVVPEALVAGTPVVATDVGAVHEVIRGGVDGLIVAPERPDEMAAAILRLWGDPDYARALTAEGSRRVAERFGEEQDAATWRRAIDVARRRS